MKIILLLSVLFAPILAMQKTATPLAPTDQSMNKAFFEAVIGGNKEEVIQLLQIEPRVNVNVAHVYPITPLESTVSTHNAEMAELLLVYGADSNQRITNSITPGRTLLMYATSRNDAPMVELLVYYGANVDATYEVYGVFCTAADFIDTTIGANEEYTRRIRNIVMPQKLKLL